MASLSLGPDQTASTIGGLAVGVPGEMRGKLFLWFFLGLDWTEPSYVYQAGKNCTQTMANCLGPICFSLL